jgi:hypothetical protein
LKKWEYFFSTPTVEIIDKANTILGTMRNKRLIADCKSAKGALPSNCFNKLEL